MDLTTQLSRLGWMRRRDEAVHPEDRKSVIEKYERRKKEKRYELAITPEAEAERIFPLDDDFKDF